MYIQIIKINKSNLFSAGIPKVKFLSTDVSKCEINLISAFNCLNIDKSKENVVSKSFTNLNFSPRSIINITPNLDRIRPPMMDLPLLPFIPSAPKRNIIRIEDIPLTNNAMECPTEIDVPEKQAVRLIVIRRRKMKKHQLKKLRKRMKFEWAKVKHNFILLFSSQSDEEMFQVKLAVRGQIHS